MRALVVYESLWGNTEKLARAVAERLSSALSVEVVSADSAPRAVEGTDLLVVAGPTHAFSMTRPATRADAVAQHGAPRAPERGIREWLGELERAPRGTRAVVFDTRVDKPRLPGSAAKAARQELRSLGFDVALKPETFRVHGYEGPLVEGELSRAAEWAGAVLRAVHAG